MIEGYSPIAQTAIGTALTWGATALGAVFCVFQPTNRKRIHNNLFLDGSLGFSAGVMLAASFWSLLQPAIDLAKTVEEVKLTNSMGSLCYLPGAVGFLAGAIFIILVDYFFPEQDLIDDGDLSEPGSPVYSPVMDRQLFAKLTTDSVRYRGNDFVSPLTFYKPKLPTRPPRISNRVWLFLVAITVHNIPEGLAVGVAFGAGDDSAAGSAFLRARNLALGMAIQNVPEGLAVSLPMRAAGYSFWQSFWYGQLSGLVEPLAGILGCITVQYIHPLQPYALGFAAGAMIFVIFDDVIPEAHQKGNGRLVSILACIGFVVMMALDVGFTS
ncbi:Zinc transporter ZIP11 [Echinococcus granulosus]|nr:Zinc transporter ZIP11 [Echinococcus granulosus]